MYYHMMQLRVAISYSNMTLLTCPSPTAPMKIPNTIASNNRSMVIILNDQVVNKHTYVNHLATHVIVHNM